MLPLAGAEISGIPPTFLERLFAGDLVGDKQAVVGDDLMQRVRLGGFPEAISRGSERRRQDWARSYLTSVLVRDLRDIAEIEKLTGLPKFVRLLAKHSGQLVNYSQLGSSINVSYKTGQRYVALLEQVVLVTTVQPWFTDALKRIARTPKVHFPDSGLLATVRGLTVARVKANRDVFGSLLESFVLGEGLKPMTASDLRLTAYHFPRPANSLGGHRAGTRRRHDRGDRDQGVGDRQAQRLPRSADPAGGVQGAFHLWRRAVRQHRLRALR